ncbi:MAG: peptidoglycan DD-metalloendopeptidase family protein [Bacteroidia bacterium]
MICWLPYLGVQAQQRPSREQLQYQIRITQELLHASESRQAHTLSELQLLDRQIELHRSVLFELATEIQAYSREIDLLIERGCVLEDQLDRLYLEHAQAARIAYQQLSGGQVWLSVIGASSLRDAYYRLIYYRFFARQRQRQMRSIAQVRGQIDAQLRQLSVEVSAREVLINAKSDELAQLEQIRQTRNALYASLRHKIKSYRLEILRKERELKDALQTNEKHFLLVTGNVQASYSESFPRQKGVLPWPVAVSYCVVVGQFGKDVDPFGNQIQNDGIYIRTREGEAVRAIHDGRISGVQKLPLSGTVVIVEHGDYRTVYANLEDVEVKPGELISAHQRLGRVRTDHRTGESLLQFLIYQEPDRFVDPARWLVDPLQVANAI